MNMKKGIITTVAALTSMMVGTAYAQDATTTTAGVPMVKLNNGVLMPRFGLGTYLQPSDYVCEQSCLAALKAGYRHIDTAHAYNDERGVGRAVKESGIPREEIWITSKICSTSTCLSGILSERGRIWRKQWLKARSGPLESAISTLTAQPSISL